MSEDGVTELDDFRPHMAVSCETPDGFAVHVVPVACFESIADGTLPLDALPERVLRTIIGEWLKDRMQQ